MWSVAFVAKSHSPSRFSFYSNTKTAMKPRKALRTLHRAFLRLGAGTPI